MGKNQPKVTDKILEIAEERGAKEGKDILAERGLMF